MVLKIYGAALSRAFRVIWLANEIGLSYEYIPVSFGGEKPECKEPWYLALNPNGRVLTIDDDGFVMWESGAINLYLAEKYRTHYIQPQWRAKVACSSGPFSFLITLSRH